MRFISGSIAFLAIWAFICSLPGAGSEYVHINEVSMHLQEENATFDLNYTLDTFTRLYVMILGCRSLEPELLSFLGCYKEVELVRADISGATLFVRGAGKYNSGYYLFDATPFGCKNEPLVDGIARFSVVYPEGRVRTFYNVTATQNVFSQAEKSMRSPGQSS